jgi:hypothetical protein
MIRYMDRMQCKTRHGAYVPADAARLLINILLGYECIVGASGSGSLLHTKLTLIN